MTTQDKPAVGPLSAGDVGKLVKGDLVRDPEGVAVVDFVEGAWIYTIDAKGARMGFQAKKLTFIGRPGPDGWIFNAEGWEENPAPGTTVEYRCRSGSTWALPVSVPSEVLRWGNSGWSGDIIAFRLAPTAPVEAGAEDDDLKLIIAHTIIEDLRVQHPGIEQIDNERGDIWIPGGSTPQSSGCTVDIHSVAQAVEQQVRATFAPGHTDLMVSPESIDAFLEVNPPPVEAGGSERGDALLRRAKGMKALGAHSITVRIDELEAALRPQPSGETLQSLAQAFEDAMEGTHGAWAVSGDEGQAGGSDAAKLLAYEDAYQVALELGYPSLTEALEHLAELTPAIPASEGGEG